MLTINFDGHDLIDKREIEKHYCLSRTMVKKRLDASGINPQPIFGRFFYPVVEVREYFEKLYFAK